MLSRIMTVIFFIPLAIILIALSVANRGSVPVSLDVFNPGNPLLTFNAPMFVWLFAALVIGIVVGGIATWFSQGRHRKLERKYKREREELRYEIEDTKRKADIVDQTPGQALIMQKSA